MYRTRITQLATGRSRDESQSHTGFPGAVLYRLCLVHQKICLDTDYGRIERNARPGIADGLAAAEKGSAWLKKQGLEAGATGYRLKPKIRRAKSSVRPKNAVLSWLTKPKDQCPTGRRENES